MGYLFQFWSAINKIREWLRGKKTLISAIAATAGSVATMLPIIISWADGKIDLQTMWVQVKIPAAIFWTSITFIFSAMHPGNINMPSQIGGNEPDKKP